MWRLVSTLSVVLLGFPVWSSANVGMVRACSCASIDPVDLVNQSDVVFTGSVISNEGSDNEPVWVFRVVGTVKGMVGPIVTVVGEDWASGCGRDFRGLAEPIVVYAGVSDNRLRAKSCAPMPTAAEFAKLIEPSNQPSGRGPPAAVMVGTHGLFDLAVLDGSGRTITSTNLGLNALAVAHCSGTPRVAVVSAEGTLSVAIVDLATFTVLDRRPLQTGFVSVTGDRLECLLGGERVLLTTGFGPNDGAVTVEVSATPAGAGGDVRSFEQVSRAVIHPSGKVLLLPSLADRPIRVLAGVDLAEETSMRALPDGASAIDGDVSPDGSKLAVLTTMSGEEVEWNTGGTHVVTLDLVDGSPVAGSAIVTPLSERTSTLDGPDGAARWIRWLDDQTLIIESETMSSKLVEFIGVDGTQVLPATDVSWGWGLVPIDAGMLRTRNGGLEVIDRRGVATMGDPAPVREYVDRLLALDHLVDLPAFELPPPTAAALKITPVTDLAEVDDADASTSEEPTSPDSQATQAPAVNSDGDRAWWPWAVVAALVGGAILAVGLIGRRRSSAATHG
jgi:hypothetical protein